MFAVCVCKLRSILVTPPLHQRTGAMYLCCRTLATSVSGATPPSATSALPTGTSTSGAAAWARGMQVRLRGLGRGGVSRERWEGDTGMMRFHLRGEERLQVGYCPYLMASLDLVLPLYSPPDNWSFFLCHPNTYCFVFVCILLWNKLYIISWFYLFYLSGYTKRLFCFFVSFLFQTRPCLALFCFFTAARKTTPHTLQHQAKQLKPPLWCTYPHSDTNGNISRWQPGCVIGSLKWGHGV